MTGHILKKIRKSKRLTQAELAARLGYNGKVHIARLEARGRKKLPAGAIARVIAYFESRK